jgi:hypothetical protein
VQLTKEVVTDVSLWSDSIMSRRNRMIFKAYLTWHNQNALKSWREDTHWIRIAELCGHSLLQPHEIVLPRQISCRVSYAGDTMRST